MPRFCNGAFLHPQTHPPVLPSIQPLFTQLLPVPGQLHGIFRRVPFKPFPGEIRANRAAVLGHAPTDQPNIIFPQAFQLR
ncbi:hypothetical protein CLV98_105264 [Dyadobacter jejuensis]|uniref:Uncharacterized protein n=1 Tax=Dyadobacter jejuensis TaxID=1082580 RepID=A0A316AKR2_9BACT|nr:hypothetical protein CLV98_105264 [Dyadobacter jejuensis]